MQDQFIYTDDDVPGPRTSPALRRPEAGLAYAVSTGIGAAGLPDLVDWPP